MLREFKNFITRGPVIEIIMGVGIAIALEKVISSFINDIFLPLVSFALNISDFSSLFVIVNNGAIQDSYKNLKAAQETGVITINYGTFINTLILFLIIGFIFFLIYISIYKFKKREKLTIKTCPFCFSRINVNATKCPNCISKIKINLLS